MGLLFVQLLGCIHVGGAVSRRAGLVVKKNLVSANMSLTLQAESLQLNYRLQHWADALPDGATRDFLRALRLCAPCKTYERIGESNDGGYVMCMDGLDKGLVGAMSYGISGYDGWGMQVASRLHIPLHEYDCTNPNEPAKCAGCEVHFHYECIRSASSSPQPNFKSFSEQISEAGFAGKPEASLLLKIDVEAAEWDIFKDEPISTLRMFREIVVEYHWLGDASKHTLYAQAVKKLEDAGFRATHLHGNNFGGPLQYFGGYSIPNVLEVTYIRGQGCAAGVPYHLPQKSSTRLL